LTIQNSFAQEQKFKIIQAEGNETKVDFAKMMQIIADSKYSGYIDVEYEGSKLSEDEGIKASITLLKKVIAPYNN
jgi:sugar phosphate isomerase/epimerase